MVKHNKSSKKDETGKAQFKKDMTEKYRSRYPGITEKKLKKKIKMEWKELEQAWKILNPGQKFCYPGKSANPSKTLTLLTGNANKLKEFQEMLGPILDTQGVQFKSQNIDLDEIQGTSDEVIARKARDGARIASGPVIIDDTCLCFNALGGLPGPYIKWFLNDIGKDGLQKLLYSFEDKSAIAECRIAYCRPG